MVTFKRRGFSKEEKYFLYYGKTSLFNVHAIGNFFFYIHTIGIPRSVPKDFKKREAKSKKAGFWRKAKRHNPGMFPECTVSPFVKFRPYWCFVLAFKMYRHNPGLFLRLLLVTKDTYLILVGYCKNCYVRKCLFANVTPIQKTTNIN